MQFEIIPAESGHAIIMDGFANIKDAEIFCNRIDQALLEKEQSDQAQIEANAIDQSKYITVNTDAIPIYNGLAELANIKGMHPKDVLDMLIQNELDECRNNPDWREIEFPDKVELIAQ